MIETVKIVVKIKAKKKQSKPQDASQEVYINHGVI